MAKYSTESESSAVNLIAQGTDIVGDVSSNGDIRIDGSLKGNISTKGKIVIGESGSIKGEVKCKNSDIEGSVDGKIIVSELLSLKATSSIKGDLVAKKLSIEPGAKFSGNCSMNPDTGDGNVFVKTQEKVQEETAKSK